MAQAQNQATWFSWKAAADAVQAVHKNITITVNLNSIRNLPKGRRRLREAREGNLQGHHAGPGARDASRVRSRSAIVIVPQGSPCYVAQGGVPHGSLPQRTCGFGRDDRRPPRAAPPAAAARGGEPASGGTFGGRRQPASGSRPTSDRRRRSAAPRPKADSSEAGHPRENQVSRAHPKP